MKNTFDKQKQKLLWLNLMSVKQKSWSISTAVDNPLIIPNAIDITRHWNQKKGVVIMSNECWTCILSRKTLSLSIIPKSYFNAFFYFSDCFIHKYSVKSFVFLFSFRYAFIWIMSNKGWTLPRSMWYMSQCRQTTSLHSTLPYVLFLSLSFYHLLLFLLIVFVFQTYLMESDPLDYQFAKKKEKSWRSTW